MPCKLTDNFYFCLYYYSAPIFIATAFLAVRRCAGHPAKDQLLHFSHCADCYIYHLRLHLEVSRLTLNKPNTPELPNAFLLEYSDVFIAKV